MNQTTTQVEDDPRQDRKINSIEDWINQL
jgi:hypothetical protein